MTTHGLSGGAFPSWRDEAPSLLRVRSDGVTNDPRRAVAKRLGRSVQGMTRKLALRLRRPPTVAFQNQIDQDAFADLVRIARKWCVTPQTMGTADRRVGGQVAGISRRTYHRSI